MAKNVKFLIVEDNDEDIQSYQDAIKNINEDLKGRFIIEAITEKTKEGGLQKLHELKNELDGAFVDLKLTHGNPVDVNEGNEIIQNIYGKLRFPIRVLTNTPGGFDQKFKKSFFLQVLTKTDVQYEDVIKSMLDIHRTGITRIFGENGMLEDLMSQIFWDHLSDSLDYWVNETNEKTLLRYALTHAIEYLELKDGKFVNYNPAEVYITPPIKPFIFTGSLLEETSTNDYFIVLSPACDLAHVGKSKSIVLAQIELLNIPLVADQKNIIKKDIAAGITPEKYTEEYVKKEKAKLTLEEIFKNNYAHKYHFLPPCAYFQGGLINFQFIQSKTPKQVQEEFIPIAAVTSNFYKDIIARFSYYYSRQGSPDFDFGELVKGYLNS